MQGLSGIKTARCRKHGYSGEDLLPAVYGDLRMIAACRLAREYADNTLQKTELIDAAWLRVCGSQDVVWENERHFFASICRAMRRILIDQARHRHRVCPIDGSDRAQAEQLEVASPMPDEQILIVDECLAALSTEDPAAAELIELRFFGGLTQAQAAKVMGLSRSAAERLWVFGRAWMAARILESRS